MSGDPLKKGKNKDTSVKIRAEKDSAYIIISIVIVFVLQTLIVALISAFY